jgi:threonine synthase
MLSFPTDDDPNPFVRFRSLFHSYHLALANEMSDEAYVALVRALDSRVAGVDGRGFRLTATTEYPELARQIGIGGGLIVKDETANVSGSHKARHLFGLLVHLEVVETLGLVRSGPRPDLAIASCGNAALAAAVVAKAGGRRLQVFVPTDADKAVVESLSALAAEITVCERLSDTVGDPTYLALQEMIKHGALPFTCQGNENGLAIEGGETLGYELVTTLRESRQRLDHLVIQVGGGALASALAEALSEAVSFGALDHMPKIHTVQTEGAWPLKRAYNRVVANLGSSRDKGAIKAALDYAARHRAGFMWPWETPPHSIAHGILDDETYDWVAVVEAMLSSGGQSVVVSDEQLIEANGLGSKVTGINVDETGSAGLAGLIELVRLGVIGPSERCAVLFTGVRR